MTRDRNTKPYLWFPGWVALVVVLCAALPARAADPLPAYGADLSQTSVSGLSSGAFMHDPVSRRALRDAGRGRGDRGRAVLLRGVLPEP